MSDEKQPDLDWTDPKETKPALDWTDMEAVAKWLADIEVYVKDLISVAEDQTDAPSRRICGRAEATRLVDEAATSLVEQLGHARRGLPGSAR